MPVVIDPAIVLAIIRDMDDDWYGLYEIVWALNLQFPVIPEAEKVSASIPVLAPLVDIGEIVLVRNVWPPREFEPIAQSDAKSIVRNSASWAPPSANPAGKYLAFGAA